MAQEIQQLEDHGTWEQVPISDTKAKILPLTWVLCRKLKARICMQGNLQEGDYVTFAPVISWISVHIFLVLSITFKWMTCSINFSNAFVQATLKEPMWTHLPRGFLSNGTSTCLCMKRSIYGLNYAPRLWWEHILKALKELGLKPSQHDQCLFYRKELMIVLYVDDAGITVPMTELIDEFINGLKAKGFELTKEGSFSEFLGIKFEEDTAAGSITMTQTGLIKKIITTTKWKIVIPTGYQLPRRCSELILKADLWKRTGVAHPSLECCCVSQPTRDPTLLSPSVKWCASIITQKSCMQPQSR